MAGQVINRAALIKKLDGAIANLSEVGFQTNFAVQNLHMSIMAQALCLLETPSESDRDETANNLKELREVMFPSGEDNVASDLLRKAECMLLSLPDRVDYLPDWHEVDQMVVAGEKLTHIQKFVHYHEPSLDVEAWRKDLKAVLGIALEEGE